MSAKGRAASMPFVRELITPEGIDLKLVLADAGERASAFFIDVLIILGVLVVVTVAVVIVGIASRFRTVDLIAAVWILAFFFLRNFYFMAFELTPRAATPGKRIIGLRVTTRDGSPLTANAIFARNAMRELEIFLPFSFAVTQVGGVDSWIGILGLIWCGVFVFFPLFNRDRLRIGDLVGGTWVVRAPKRILDVDLASRASAVTVVFDEAALDAYGIKELNILEDVLRRKDISTMRAVAARIRTKIKFKGNLPDEAFLSLYYAALRGRLETRLLFGTRRRDKYEKV